MGMGMRTRPSDICWTILDNRDCLVLNSRCLGVWAVCVGVRAHACGMSLILLGRLLLLRLFCLID